MFYADLHIHSKYSRATSRDCDLENLALWAQKKGIRVVATGDFTHPAWRAELEEKLVPAEAGLFRLRPDLERAVGELLPPSCLAPVRFLLSVEISTIYKKGEKTRKVHHLVYVPDLSTADRVIGSLSRIGNLHSDGRPILGLDSRHLLEVTLDSGPDSFLIPAHVWTPWFAALGSKSGFDAIDDCYGDLASHVFAVETGLSSDPEMNWRVSSLDRFRLVSNSDAHSPPKLGREACVFACDLSYHGLKRALETGDGYVGTVEFFPEEGKYHLDGHRKCGVRLEPAETKRHGGRCPVCTRPLTIGVMHRVHDLSDRAAAVRPETAGEVRSRVALPEILGELNGTSSSSRRVAAAYEALVRRLGPELEILESIPTDEIGRVSSSLLREAIERARSGDVIREAGYDGEYGVIRLFGADELKSRTKGGVLFDLALDAPHGAPSPVAAATGDPEASPRPVAPDPARPPLPLLAGGEDVLAADDDVLAGLDDDQHRAAAILCGPLVIVAGPGSGKTRTLIHRIAHLVRSGVDPARCLAITFTRRAAEEMVARLRAPLGEPAARVTVTTFHGFGYAVLAEHGGRVGVHRGFRVATPRRQRAALKAALDVTESRVSSWLSRISRAKRQGSEDRELDTVMQAYQAQLDVAGRVDFDDLVLLAVRTLEDHDDVRAAYRARFEHVAIDEFQDVDPLQYRLVRALVPPAGNACVIGDPDQAIYGFRGADPRLFARFREDYANVREARLTRNYRSTGTIVRASRQVMLDRSDAGVAAGDDEALARVVIHEAPSERAEAEFVVSTIERMLGGHSFFSIDSGRADGVDGGDLSFSDFAILYRTDAIAEAVVEALARSGMPFRRHAHASLCDAPGVPEVLAAIEAEDRSAPVGSVLERVRAAAAALDLGDDVVDLLRPLSDACGDDHERFLREVEMAEHVDAFDPRADRVALLTLHASKGLEFRVVFIVGCEDGLLPLTFGAAEREPVDEERRLFYVGVTRARDRLLLCRAKRRVWRGRSTDRSPSPFVGEIEERLLERSTSRASRPKPSGRQLELF